MKDFKLFVESTSDIRNLPHYMMWITNFFDRGIDTTTLKIWGDWLEENHYDKAAELFHRLGNNWRNPKLKKGLWGGDLVGLFYDVFGFFHDYARTYDINDRMQGSWFFHLKGEGERMHQMYRHIVHPEQTSYRLSLTNGKWFSYTNTGEIRASVVSTRHVPTDDTERYYPGDRVTVRDYKPISIKELPQELLLCAFYRIIEKQARGSH